MSHQASDLEQGLLLDNSFDLADGTTSTSDPSPCHNELLHQQIAIQKGLKDAMNNTSLPWSRRSALVNYYKQQLEILCFRMEVEQVSSRGGGTIFDDVAAEEEQLAQRALNLSFASNVVLLAVRGAIVALTGSLSLMIAFIDAVLDVLSSCLMYWASWESRRPGSKYEYPVGKERLEPLGVVAFSSIMGTAAFTVIVAGIQQLISGNTPDEAVNTVQWVVIGGTIFVVIMKLALYLYCRRSANVAVQAFSTDHLNDVVVNTFSMAGALLGVKVAWWLDPSMAILISFAIMYLWGSKGIEQLYTLVGQAASPLFMSKLTYISVTHRPDVVKEVDTVRAYTAGVQLIAEIDLVLPADMPLKAAHDVGEQLQIKLEGLPGIVRAFVHLDTESSHKPEHNGQ